MDPYRRLAWHVLFTLICFLLAWAEPSSAADDAGTAAERKSLNRDPDYVIIKGELLRNLVGQRISELGLYAFVQGAVKPMTFQIDECDPRGRLVCPRGSHPETDSDAGVFDENDELVFMAADSGDRTLPDARPSGWKKAEEIELLDPVTGGRAWCYLVLTAGPPARSGTDYIDYFPDEDKYVALYNTGVYMRDGIHRADYNCLLYPPAAGGTGVDIVDRLKIRIEIRLKVPPSTIRFDEDDTEVETLSYIDGPIRIVRRNQLYLRVPFLTIPFGGSHDVIVYRDTNDTPIEVTVPKGASWLIRSLAIRLGTDLAPAAVGMLWFNTSNPEGAIIDGIMSEQEKHLDLSHPEEDMDSYWQVIAGPQGAMMRRGHYNPGMKGILKASINYLDEQNTPDPPEEFPGQIGHSILNLSITRVHPGTYTFMQQWYHPHHFYPFRNGSTDRYMNIRNRPLTFVTEHGKGDVGSAAAGGPRP